MNNKDKEAFIVWYKNKESEFDNCKEAWQAALDYERERSKILVEALEKYKEDYFVGERAFEALKKYKGMYE
jgi:hypothetical protein